MIFLIPEYECSHPTDRFCFNKKFRKPLFDLLCHFTWISNYLNEFDIMSYWFYMILYVFHMILCGFHKIPYAFYMIFYGFHMILYCFIWSILFLYDFILLLHVFIWPLVFFISNIIIIMIIIISIIIHIIILEVGPIFSNDPFFLTIDVFPEFGRIFNVWQNF